MKASKERNRMMDPRTSIIEERMKRVRRIIAISSGKGGVGKSIVASVLALCLSEKGNDVGLFDLDFTSPSTHIILGAENIQLKEEKGIVPAKVHRLEYMSIVYFSGDQPAPLRGMDASNALIELLSITKWGKLDFLLLDMPPGIGDATLDLIRLIKRIEFLIVTTPSQLAFETVKKLGGLLKELKVPILGVAENMVMDRDESIQQQTQKLGLRFLEAIEYDAEIEESIGDVNRLLQSVFAKEVGGIADKI